MARKARLAWIPEPRRWRAKADRPVARKNLGDRRRIGGPPIPGLQRHSLDSAIFHRQSAAAHDVYPSSKRYSGVLSGHQTLAESLELFGDALVEHDDGFRAYNTGGDFARMQLITNKTNSTSANTGLRWQPFGDWHLEGNALFSQVDTLASVDYSPAFFGYTNGTPYLRNLDTIKETDVKLDGTLWASGGSAIKAAAGGSYRREDFSSLVEFTSDNREVNRRVHAAFAEIYAPLISDANAIMGIRRLELSAAVRNDTYSDFAPRPTLG